MNARQLQIYLLIISAAKLKPGRFPYLDDEARQVCLYGIVPCTSMKNRLYPTLLFFLLRLKFDNDVIINLGRLCYSFAPKIWVSRDQTQPGFLTFLCVLRSF